MRGRSDGQWPLRGEAAAQDDAVMPCADDQGRRAAQPVPDRRLTYETLNDAGNAKRVSCAAHRSVTLTPARPVKGESRTVGREVRRPAAALVIRDQHAIGAKSQ